MVQSGDFSSGNGKGGESIFNGFFEDESFEMKHTSPFLLSMANKGPDTNGSQFFITTAEAPHLDGVHVVFGQVISGKEVIQEIEELQVDKKNRPLQDARIVKCGELIPKKKAVESSEEESSSSSSDEEEKEKKKLKKLKKKAKKAAKKAKKAEKEEGELDEGEQHPLVQLTSIDPDSIPDVPSNRFLDRNPAQKTEDYRDRDEPEKGRSERNGGGKKMKGRGMMMFRRDKSRSRSGSGGRRRRSRSRSRGERRRGRSQTPPHWRQAEKRTISLAEYEKNKKEEERKEKERDRREEERRERHLARKAEDEKRAREKDRERQVEDEERRRNEEARKERRFREERRKETEGMDYDKLDFDPEDGEDDENTLRLRALETQARNLIPNYGSPPKPRLVVRSEIKYSQP